MSFDHKRIEELIGLARRARDNAYNPYSDFRVGASVLTIKGNIYTGSSVDNFVYNLSTCAERSAITNAASNGDTDVIAIAVISDLEDQFISPCGGCREVIAEFGYKSNCTVILTKSSGLYYITSIRDLLPVNDL